jgi:hypothetical protein
MIKNQAALKSCPGWGCPPEAVRGEIRVREGFHRDFLSFWQMKKICVFVFAFPLLIW